MSVVAVKVLEDKIEVASDSIVVYGWTQRKIAKGEPGAKLFSVNNMIIGGAGRMEELQLFMLYASTHKPAAITDLDITQFMAEFSDWKYKRFGKFEIDNSYILVIDGSAWCTEGFCCTRIINFDAVGAGMDFALAALHLGKSPKEAVEISCELSAMCELPVNTFTYDRNTKRIY